MDQEWQVLRNVRVYDCETKTWYDLSTIGSRNSSSGGIIELPEQRCYSWAVQLKDEVHVLGGWREPPLLRSAKCKTHWVIKVKDILERIPSGAGRGGSSGSGSGSDGNKETVFAVVLVFLCMLLGFQP